MVAMANTRCFCDGSISKKKIQGHKLYKCTKFHAFIKKWSFFHISPGLAVQKYRALFGSPK